MLAWCEPSSSFRYVVSLREGGSLPGADVEFYDVPRTMASRGLSGNRRYSSGRYQ